MGKSSYGLCQFVSGMFVFISCGHTLNLILDDRADYMQGTRLTFRSKEDAIHFAEKQGVYQLLHPIHITDVLYSGWDYFVYSFLSSFL